ncbi:MAG: tRNA lysidine(34) synthetase TilS, partial [Lachnospiraceae bacterium]|nr:tRNA lysidine(34) synthetase TilS [Lachnospiraceae bacterium]
MNRLVEKVSEYMQEHHMVENGQKIVVGVSGGADSMALLCVLSELADAFGISLVVVHVNHGIRGKSADGDQAYVEDFCQKEGIVSYSFHIDLKRFAQKEGMTLEEAGRFYRYQCFENVRKEVGAHKIAVAHHQEDACETILFNLFRGTGIKGLTGILPVRDAIIRPLLCASRQDIEKYLQEQGISWRTDETNLTDDYSRNKIRHHVIPYVEEHINSASGQHIQEMAELLRDVSDYLDEQSAKAFDACVRVGEHPICAIQSAAFTNLHVVIQREVLRRAIHVAAGKLKDVDKEHIEMVRELFNKHVGRRVHLPYQLEAVRTYAGVDIKKIMISSDISDQTVCIDAGVPGHYRISELSADVELRLKESFQ